MNPQTAEHSLTSASTGKVRRSYNKSLHQDRFIPLRDTRRWSQVRRLHKTSSMLNDEASEEGGLASSSSGSSSTQESESTPISNAGDDIYFGGDASTTIYRNLLQSEMIDFDIDLSSKKDNHNGSTTTIASGLRLSSQKNHVVRGLFTYSTPDSKAVFAHRQRKLYSLSPLSERSVAMLKSHRKPASSLPRARKILDAPGLADSFYFNLIDWSSRNVLAAGLASTVYLYNYETAVIQEFIDITTENFNPFCPNQVASVSWSEKADLLALGTTHGEVQIWDAEGRRTARMRPHGASTNVGFTSGPFRVGAMAWNGNLLAAGSPNGDISLIDTRLAANSTSMWSATNAAVTHRLSYHEDDVCGLRWSPDRVHLASGGSDNKLLVWSATNGKPDKPQQCFTGHQAAVRAIAWSPHRHGLLASGGGTADRTIRFWNTLTEGPIQSIDTGSQVCNLAWSKYSSELVSTHGYWQNQIVVWKYPSLARVSTMTGHKERVLYLAASPHGEMIATAAGGSDVQVRFWKAFDKTIPSTCRSQLDLFSTLR